MAGKKNNGGSGRRRKPNYKLPSDDHLVVPEIKRTKEEEEDAGLARLLSHNWDFFTSKERKKAQATAFVFGVNLAEEAHADGEDTDGGEKDYRRVCVRWAFENMKVINDVERSLWSSANSKDPRFSAFQMGFEKRRAELEPAM